MAQKGFVRTTGGYTWQGVNYDLGEFKTFSGGQQTAGRGKSRGGVGQAMKARGGQQDISDVTVTCEDDGTRNLKQLAAIRGRVRGWVTRTPSDDTGNPRASDAETFTGYWCDVNLGDADVEDEQAIDMVTLVLQADGVTS